LRKITNHDLFLLLLPNYTPERATIAELRKYGLYNGITWKFDGSKYSISEAFRDTGTNGYLIMMSSVSGTMHHERCGKFHAWSSRLYVELHELGHILRDRFSFPLWDDMYKYFLQTSRKATETECGSRYFDLFRKMFWKKFYVLHPKNLSESSKQHEMFADLYSHAVMGTLPAPWKQKMKRVLSSMAHTIQKD